MSDFITKLSDLIDPEVMGDMVSARIPKKLRVAPFAKIDDTLAGVPGDTITVPAYTYIGDASDVAEGGEVAIEKMTTSTRKATIKKAMKGIGLTDEDETIRRIGDAEIAVINKAPVTRKVIDSCPNLKLITVLATGYNVVDVAYAKEKGIPVCNVPNYGGYSVSQFTIALMLEACLHIGHHDRTVHEGKWQNSPDWCYWDYPLIELAGKTFGLLGCGRIGIHTAEAAKGLGMHVIAYNRSQSQAAKDLGVEFVDLDGLFARSDVLALQMPLADFNVGIINKENIAKMKDGVIILNNSRGQMVVEQDLADALNSGKVAFAGLDVVSTEPIRADNPLLTAKNCIITPHMSWGSQGSRQRIMDCTVNNIRAFLSGAPENVVNP